MSTTKNNEPNRGRTSASPRRPIKVTPRRKAQVDPHMISLVYFLIASRIVREAKDKEAAAARREANGSGGDEPADTGQERS